jgi:hypothetical protein
MKKFAIIIFTLFFSLQSFAGAKNLRLIPKTAVALYLGIENQVQLIGDNINLKDVILDCKDLEISVVKGDAKFIVLCRDKEKIEVKITIRNKAGKKLGKIKCVFIPIPNPQATILGLKSGNITKKQFKKAKEIEIEMVDFPFDIKVELERYTMVIFLGGDKVEFRNKDAELSGRMKKMLSRVRSGATITFEAIQVKMPNGEKRTIAPLVYNIID